MNKGTGLQALGATVSQYRALKHPNRNNLFNIYTWGIYYVKYKIFALLPMNSVAADENMKTSNCYSKMKSLTDHFIVYLFLKPVDRTEAHAHTCSHMLTHAHTFTSEAFRGDISSRLRHK